MKKVLLILSAVFLFNSSKAQLANTKWKGAIETNKKHDVVFNFSKDSLEVNALQDGSNIETMTFAVKDSVITLKKVSGQSDCDAGNTANYSFNIKGEVLTMRLLKDNCSDRSNVLSNSQWTKMK